MFPAMMHLLHLVQSLAAPLVPGAACLVLQAEQHSTLVQVVAVRVAGWVVLVTAELGSILAGLGQLPEMAVWVTDSIPAEVLVQMEEQHSTLAGVVQLLVMPVGLPDSIPAEVLV